MKKNLLTLILLFSALSLSAKNVVVKNPAYELRTSGIYNITQIETTKDETLLRVYTTFVPKMWVMFTENTFIQDTQTGEKFYATRMENGKFDSHIYMGASGDSTFVVAFPKLDKRVKKINFGWDEDKEEDDVTAIYGVSLDPKAKQPDRATVPTEVQTWLEQEVAKAKKQTIIADLESKEFFSPDSIRIVGYIKGYDTRVGFSTGIVYSENVMTRESSPMVVKVHPDGRFETTLPANYPIRKYIAFNGATPNFYAEPGQTLAMILDWEDFLRADRFRNRNYEFELTQFIGPAAVINQELMLAATKLPILPVRKIYQEMDKKSPEDFVAYVKPFAEQLSVQTEQLCAGEGWTQTTQTILRNDYKVQYAYWLLDYDQDNRYRKQDGKKFYPLPDGYFDFLRDIPMNNQSLLLSSNYSSFINRLEYCGPLRSAQSKVYAQLSQKKSFHQYLFEELNLPKTEEDKLFISALDSLNIKLNLPGMTKEKRDEELKKFNELSKPFNERYKEYMDAYQKKYVETIRKMTQGEMQMEISMLQDSVARELGFNPSLTYDITKVRGLDFTFKNGKVDESRKYLDRLEKEISNTYLVNEAERLFTKNYPDTPKVAYELPEGRAADIFRKIIEPHKGKFLFVDFWGIFCGPCIHGISTMKETREMHKESEDIRFIFITSENESPTDRYDKFVSEQDLKITHRLTEDEYLYLRELFKFNGIPRYVLVDREGRIMDDDFKMHNFEYELSKLLEKNK